jgi:hypothetical protein
MKRVASEWEKIFVKDTSGNGLVSKICKEHLTLNRKKTKNVT